MGARPIPIAAGLASLAALAFAAGNGPADWSLASANRYLEARQTYWFEFTARQKEQKQRDGAEACVSCHTGLPYLLARPALARALGETGPNEFERVYLARLRHRLQHPEEQLYHAYEPTRSRATEAILSSLLLSQADRLRDGRLSESSEEAFRHLWATQLQEGALRGSWEWLNVDLDPWEAPAAAYFGTALAALAVGGAPAGYAARPEIQAQIGEMNDYLRREFRSQPLHGRLASLWAASRMPKAVAPADRESTLAKLWEAQNADGGWSLPAIGPWKTRPKTSLTADSDAYATAFAACALKQAGVAPATPGLARALAWLRKNQNAQSGAWESRSMNSVKPADDPLGKLMTDAATGYAVLALLKSE